MARASWKLCSISGLHTPSASLSVDLSAESLIRSMSSAGLSLPLQLLGSIVAVGPSKLEPGADYEEIWNFQIHNKQLLSITEPGTFGSKTQHNAVFAECSMWDRSSQTSLVIAKNVVDLEEMDRVKTLDTGNNFKVTNQSNPVESLNDLEELFIAQYFYRKLHEKINHGI